MNVNEAERIKKGQEKQLNRSERMNTQTVSQEHYYICACSFLECHELYKPLVEALEYAIHVAKLNETVDGAYTGPTRTQLEQVLAHYRTKILGEK